MSRADRKSLVIVENLGFCGKELARSGKALKSRDIVPLMEGPSQELGSFPSALGQER